MRPVLALMLLLMAPNLWAAPTVWSTGLGMESRMQREVNPDYVDMRNSGTLYAKARFWPMAALLEAAREDRDSHSGDLRIKASSMMLGVWGRYEFRDPDKWSPFAGLGAGQYFDQVQTSFGEQVDTRKARRGFMGVGLGLTKTYWQHLLLELEARAAAIQRRDQIQFSGLFRVGFTF